ncbi:cation:proton antiporter [Protaetiibacter intestinalis]|uniref:Sodium:proton antiporter n=1 Tax=Protaetiibacter intestinalis TaxID=2419774 RepID=A0A387BAB1_9MICO|nr:sodium:proton antiporter [Protaetiibacter intestinalis]AYF98648.1 sodium:proton antiporter [Protaetiibacter intestinalis]
MTQLLVVLVLALVVIAASTLLGRRLGIASPLVLVAVGVAASFLPAMTGVEIEPEWILEGVLPPLLYSAAVSMPAMNFRREFGAIGGLSVVLVVVTSLLLGVFFMLVIPDLGFVWGVALGAVVSPTDAVATSIIKRTSVSSRAVAMLDGESLLNDASALVVLRTAIVATAAAFSFWGTVGTFAYSVLVAMAIGGLVGWLNLAVRRRISDATVNTVISFTVPFLASVPAELAGASGLVAAVVAGLVSGIRAPRVLSPQHRLSDAQNWHTVEFVLEGAVFLTMGLQLTGIVEAVERDHAGAGVAVLIAVGALVLTILIRAAYVAPLLWVLGRRSRRGERLRGRLEDAREQMSTPEGKRETLEELNAQPTPGRRPRRDAVIVPGAGGPRRRTARDVEVLAVRVRRALADIDYFVRRPLGWRDGVVVVWAGMRGAVTVAAAQTLPVDTPQRSVLVLIAFAVALLSLLVQGGTVGPLVRRITPKRDEVEARAEADAEWTRLMELLRTASDTIPAPPEPARDIPSREQLEQQRTYRMAVLQAQRTALLDARDDGTFDAEVLENALANLDASQIAIELRGPRGG